MFGQIASLGNMGAGLAGALPPRERFAGTSAHCGVTGSTHPATCRPSALILPGRTPAPAADLPRTTRAASRHGPAACRLRPAWLESQRGVAYLGGMAFLDPPGEAQKRTRFWIGTGAVLATAIIMTGFMIENRSGYMKPDPKLIYMQNWKGDRTRADALADARATEAARAARLAEARAAIATMTGKAREDAQKQYDAYVAAEAIRKDIPYVPASQPAVTGIVTAPSSAPAEPPVE